MGAVAVTVATSVAIGAAMGAITSAIQGGDVLKGMLMGGAMGAVTGGVGAAMAPAATAAGTIGEGAAMSTADAIGNSGFSVIDAVQPIGGAMTGTGTMASELGSGLAGVGADTLSGTSGLLSAGGDSLINNASLGATSYLPGAGSMTDFYGNALTPSVGDASGSGALWNASGTTAQNAAEQSAAKVASDAGQPTWQSATAFKGDAAAPAYGAQAAAPTPAPLTNVANSGGDFGAAQGGYGTGTGALDPTAAATSGAPPAEGAILGNVGSPTALHASPDWFARNLGVSGSKLLEAAPHALTAVGALGQLASGSPKQPTQDSGNPSYSYQAGTPYTNTFNQFRNPNAQAATAGGGSPQWFNVQTGPANPAIDPVTGKPIVAQKKGGPAGKGPKVVARIPASQIYGGQDDVVPIMAARDEHVIPADVVAHLGDGSSQAGHAKLKAMTNNVRQAKTGNKKFPGKAKPDPLSYAKRATA